jgi:hypothetical protein
MAEGESLMSGFGIKRELLEELEYRNGENGLTTWWDTREHGRFVITSLKNDRNDRGVTTVNRSVMDLEGNFSINNYQNLAPSRPYLATEQDHHRLLTQLVREWESGVINHGQ